MTFALPRALPLQPLAILAAKNFLATISLGNEYFPLD